MILFESTYCVPETQKGTLAPSTKTMFFPPAISNGHLDKLLTTTDVLLAHDNIIICPLSHQFSQWKFQLTLF